jgi:hypothetical protein
MRLGKGDETGIGLRLEIERMPLADEAVTDDSDADALIRPGDARITARCQCRRAGGKE